jgi:hypothetical protein
MEKQPGQFGIFSLLVLMTAAALAFAVIRLPIPIVGKLCAVLMIAVCFYGWAVRNWKYRDPRSLPPASPAARRLGIVLNLVIWAMLMGHLLWSYMRLGPRSPGWADVLMWTAIPLGLATVLWSAVRRW